MQKYMLLSSQQEVLRRRLSLSLPSAAPLTAGSPEFRSLASSPISTRSMYSTSWPPEAGFAPSVPIPTEPGVAHRHDIGNVSPLSEDSQKLCEVNQQIKATLTEMLNTESVRSDDKYRTWIQERLMDAEHHLRKQRRRHSSIDQDVAASIATHISPRMAWHQATY